MSVIHFTGVSTSAVKLPLMELGTCQENNGHFQEIIQLTYFGMK